MEVNFVTATAFKEKLRIQNYLKPNTLRID